MITGDVAVTYDDHEDEHCVTSDLLYWPPGHSVRVDTDAELLMFSPQADHGSVLDHILTKMSSA